MSPSAEQILSYLNTTPKTVDVLPPVSPGGMTNDAFSNVISRLGFGTPSMLEGTSYPMTRLTRDYQLMNSLYRSHWIVRRIIDIIPQDMVKNWFEIESEITPEQIKKIKNCEQRTRTKHQIQQALKWARLYGGAGALIVIKGSENRLNEPLDPREIMPGSYKGLIVFDRWSGITPAAHLITDIESPDFGMPEFYRVTPKTGKAVNVHSSRILRFIGRDLPYWEEQAEVGWGISEIEVIFDELKKRDNTSWNIASLVFMANIRVFKMGKLGEALSVQNAAAQQNLYNTLSAQNHLLSNMGMQVINKDDEFDTKQFSFAGLADVYKLFMMDMCGCSRIPATKLYGRSPEGMNATGDSDLQNYYDDIAQEQESKLYDNTLKLTKIISLSELGFIPPDLNIRFLTCETVRPDKLADLAEKKTNAVSVGVNSIGVPRAVALKELKAMSKETGMWTNLTDADVAQAEKDEKEEKKQQQMSFDLAGKNPDDENGKKGNAALAGKKTTDEFVEADHKRDNEGKFSTVAGTGAETAKKATEIKPKKIGSRTTEEGKFSHYDIEKNVIGRADMFTVHEDKGGWIVRNAIIPENMQKQGIATEFYKRMNAGSLKATGNPLRSTRPRTLITGEKVHEVSELGVKLWEKLVREGYAEKLGDKDYRFKTGV